MSYRVSTPDGNTQAFDTQAEADARAAEIRRGSDRAQVVTWRDGFEEETG
jgi:hypothetical protein